MDTPQAFVTLPLACVVVACHGLATTHQHAYRPNALSPHQTHPHRPHHVVDRGLAAPKNPRLAGTEDQGLVERRPRYVATRSRHSGGGNQCVSRALVCKYVPMRVEAREVDCSPCTVPVGWPQPDCPARRPSARGRTSGKISSPPPPPTRPPPTTGGQFYLGEVVGYKPEEGTFQVVYDDETQQRAPGQEVEVRVERRRRGMGILVWSVMRLACGGLLGPFVPTHRHSWPAGALFNSQSPLFLCPGMNEGRGMCILGLDTDLFGVLPSFQSSLPHTLFRTVRPSPFICSVLVLHSPLRSLFLSSLPSFPQIYDEKLDDPWLVLDTPARRLTREREAAKSSSSMYSSSGGGGGGGGGGGYYGKGPTPPASSSASVSSLPPLPSLSQSTSTAALIRNLPKMKLNSKATYADLIIEALKEIHGRDGASLVAIRKWICKNNAEAASKQKASFNTLTKKAILKLEAEDVVQRNTKSSFKFSPSYLFRERQKQVEYQRMVQQQQKDRARMERDQQAAKTAQRAMQQQMRGGGSSSSSAANYSSQSMMSYHDLYNLGGGGGGEGEGGGGGGGRVRGGGGSRWCRRGIQRRWRGQWSRIGRCDGSGRWRWIDGMRI